MNLQGRRAVVTGGGRGIGAACALRLAEAGATVAVCSRSRDEVEAVAERIGGGAIALTCDVTRVDDVAAMAAAIEQRLGDVDILVNNAGAASSAPLGRETLENWDRMIAVNATSTFLCLRAFVPGMVERGWGRAVNVASVSGLHGARYICAYTAAKHAVIGLTRSVAAETARSGVTVNAVCPGYVDTPMTEETVDNIMRKTGKTRDEARDAILKMTPQRRLITPDEVAHQVVSLCHEESRGINGQSVVVDGGGLLA